MNNLFIKTIVPIVVVLGFGSFIFYAATHPVKLVPTQPLPDVPISNPQEGLMSLKHSFVPQSAGFGEHIYRGIMQLPTPCHELVAETAVAESYPEQIQIYFKIVPQNTICIERIDERPFEVRASASPLARLGLVMVNGEPRQFSVQEEAVRVPDPPHAAVILGEPFTLAFGEEKRREDLAIRFTGVKSDSRCPVNADCFWQGEAVLEFEVFDPRAPEDALETITLSFPGEQSRTIPEAKSYALFGAYGIHLIGVEPMRSADRATDTQDYRATLVINPVE